MKNLAIAKRLCVSSAQKVTTVNFLGGKVIHGGGSMWDTGGGGPLPQA